MATTIDPQLIAWYENLDPISKALFLTEVLAAYPGLAQQMSDLGLTEIEQITIFTDEAIRARSSEEVIR